MPEIMQANVGEACLLCHALPGLLDVSEWAAVSAWEYIFATRGLPELLEQGERRPGERNSMRSPLFGVSRALAPDAGVQIEFFPLGRKTLTTPRTGQG